MKKQRILASLTAAALAAASLPAVAASSVEYNTWTGYVLRNAAGNCLSVLGGSEGEGAQVDFTWQTAQHPIIRGISPRQTPASPSSLPFRRASIT